MPTTTPRQAVQRISNKSATIRHTATTIQQLERSQSITEIEFDLAENVRKRQECVPVTSSHGGSQPNFAAIIYAGRRKKRWRSVVYFLSKYDRKKIVQTGNSFGNHGHLRSLRMVPFDRRQNFLYFLFSGPHAYLVLFWSYSIKTILQKMKVGCYGKVPWKFENRGTDRSSTAIAGPNGETAWKSIQCKLR